MFELEVFGVQLWQWIGLILLGVAAYFLSRIAVRLLVALLRPLVARTATTLDDRIVDAAVVPLRCLLLLGVLSLIRLRLELPPAAHEFLTDVLMTLAVTTATWLALRLVDAVSGLAAEHLSRMGRTQATAIVPLGRRVVKVFLGAIALLLLLQNVGFNVTGLIAGLGVGGLAVALAAQKSIANLFGGVSLIVDQPVRVGDLCRFGDGQTGTIEEIGLRSTRVRTPERTLISIPNSVFSEIQLENYGARDKIRLFAILGLRYETTPDQLRAVLGELHKLLASHPMLSGSPVSVRFVAFGAYSLNVELSAHARTRDPDEFLAIREQVFLRVMDVVEACGTGFAFPSQTLYLGRDRAPSAASLSS